MTQGLREMHEQEGAAFAAGAGRPLHYGDVSGEYAAARRTSVLIDRSHRGRLRVAGRDRVDLLHRLTSNDVGSLASGQGVLNLFLTNKGRIVELFDQLAFDDHLLLCLAASGAAHLVPWIDRFVFSEDVVCTNDTAQTSEFLLAGPAAAEALREAGADSTPDTHRDHSPVTIGGVAAVVGAAEALSGGAYRFVTRADDGADLWHALLHLDNVAGPAGEQVEMTLRIEAGLPAPGHEASERFNPLEVGLDDAVSFTKGCFTGQEVVARLHNYDKVQRALCGVMLDTGEPPAIDAPVEIDGKAQGFVTSSTSSPGFAGPLALALIERQHATPGRTVSIGGSTGTLASLPMTPPPGSA